MDCSECLKVFQAVGDAFNSPMGTSEMLETVSKTLVERFRLKGCHFRLLSRDQRILEDVASYGLSDGFLLKGPVDAEKSVAEALEGRTVMVFDCATDDRIQYRDAFIMEGITSMLTVPIRARGQVIGVMRLSTSLRREFSDQELQIVEVVADFAASAIIHSMFHGVLDRVTELIRASNDLDTILQGIVRVAVEDLRTKGAVIHLVEDGRRLRLGAADGLSDMFLRAVFDEAGGAVTEALQGVCVQAHDARCDDRVPSPELVEKEGVGSMLFVPLAVGANNLGVLTLCTHDLYRFSEDEIFLMRSIGDHCALAIRNAQMYASVKRRYDTLTVDFQQWFEHYVSTPAGAEKTKP